MLIVDDSPADRALFRTILSRGGMTVHETSRGSQAVERARELRPHVIVLDVNLPDSDGYSVCRALRTDPLCAGIPVLLLTSWGDEHNVEVGLEAGADDYLLKDAPGPIILARVRRLARYRQLATVAALNEQLAQVGRLMAGIIHEIRGPLSVIRGNAELLKMQAPPGHQFHQWIEPLLRSTRLLQIRLEHLMAAVRTGPPALAINDVTSVAKESIEIFTKSNDPRAGKVSVELETVGEPPHVLADAGRLIQVFLNLLTNARDAILSIRESGSIKVVVESCRRDDREWVKIDVSDDGPGVPEVAVDRIFEPFFTTKAEGSGYGLYLASEIIREHGGRLTACNKEAGGACFTIWLPVDQDAPRPA